jgi:Domain of unknown function (DUF5615)
VNLLLDECIPRPLKGSFISHGHSCLTVPEAGFAGKTNGELLRLAQNRFDVFITLDKGIPHQQNLAYLKIAVLVIRAKTNQMIDVLPHVAECLAEMDTIEPGEVRYVGR